MDFGMQLNLPFKLLIQINICAFHPIMFLRMAFDYIALNPGLRFASPGLGSSAPPARHFPGMRWASVKRAPRRGGQKVAGGKRSAAPGCLTPHAEPWRGDRKLR